MKSMLLVRFKLFLKGIAMGAADVVPGVSGGTIAFISGIYEELIESINSVNFATLKQLKSEGLAAAWKSINGNFLITLFAGILVSIASLAKLISYLLENHAVLLWSFFFGLILASIIYVGKTIPKWNWQVVVALLAGTAISYWITILPPAAEPGALWFIFIAGMIAICAMILPGISGSFILLLLGAYPIVISAIKEFNIAILAVFGVGCVTGLLSFSKLLNWMFKKYYALTIAVLTGFLVGSLNKIWPWKQTVSFRTNSHGEEVPFIQTNVSPEAFTQLTETDAQLGFAVLMLAVGFSLIFVLEKLATEKPTT
jgi:putative membrane protein